MQLAVVQVLGSDLYSSQLEETLRRSASDHKNELAAEVAHLHYQVQTLVEASEASAQVIQDLETNIRGRGEEINHLKQMLAASQQEAETSSRALAEAEDSHVRETADLGYQRQILQQQLDLANSGIQAHSQDLRAQRESLRLSVQAAATAAAEADDIRSRLDLMSCEVDRLQKEIILMRSQSANKEVQITQLQKLRDQLKEDKEMLNIALDSKQQELEIVSQKLVGEARTSTSYAVHCFCR
jgi:chromosome segregation ATPase